MKIVQQEPTSPTKMSLGKMRILIGQAEKNPSEQAYKEVIELLTEEVGKEDLDALYPLFNRLEQSLEAKKVINPLRKKIYPLILAQLEQVSTKGADSLTATLLKMYAFDRLSKTIKLETWVQDPENVLGLEYPKYAAQALTAALQRDIPHFLKQHMVDMFYLKIFERRKSDVLYNAEEIHNFIQVAEKQGISVPEDLKVAIERKLQPQPPSPPRTV